MFLIMTIIPR